MPSMTHREAMEEMSKPMKKEMKQVPPKYRPMMTNDDKADMARMLGNKKKQAPMRRFRGR